MAFEVGKNRLEALGDVEETADLLRYYSDVMERNAGFEQPMGSLSPTEKTRCVLQPHGVWAVISPFNFPMALAGGPAAGALIAGNTVVIKPSSDAPLMATSSARRCARPACRPASSTSSPGPGETVGAELQENPGIDGLVFTGSYEVGMKLYTSFTRDYPRPIITEMGGKNPAIVTASADLDIAAEGVMRSAFGYDGQKCSANSRVYVDRRVAREFVDRLVERTKADHRRRPDPARELDGPGHQRARAAQVHRCSRRGEARRRHDRGRRRGPARRADGGRGFFPTPTVVTGLPLEHRLFHDELFVPLLVVGEVDSLDEALEHANASAYGLTAGIFSGDQAEIDRFLDTIQAGVVYVNRRAGATTGAWPGIQSFGGWKGSGSSGKSGLGPYYVQQFMREQSQTVIGDGARPDACPSSTRRSNGRASAEDLRHLDETGVRPSRRLQRLVQRPAALCLPGGQRRRRRPWSRTAWCWSTATTRRRPWDARSRSPRSTRTTSRPRTAKRADSLRGDRGHQGARRPAGRRDRGLARVHGARRASRPTC